MLLAVCLISVTVSFHLVSAAEPVVVRLKEKAVVESDRILLKDVAELSGPDSRKIGAMAQTPLCAAPPFGVVSTLSRHQIIDMLRKADGFFPEAAFSGATIIQIRLKGKPADPEEIALLLKSHLAENTPWQESEIEIQSIENLQGIELPRGDAFLRVASRSPIMGRGKIVFPMEVVQDGQVVRMFWPTAKIRIHAEIMMAAKAIRSGRPVASEDMVRSRAEILDLQASYLRTPDEIIGKVSRRNFSPGDPLGREAFSNPCLIRHGETIQLRLERSGLALTSLGRAEQDGRLGQIIKVRSLEFSTLLNAIVTGRAEARIQ